MGWRSASRDEYRASIWSPFSWSMSIRSGKRYKSSGAFLKRSLLWTAPFVAGPTCLLAAGPKLLIGFQKKGAASSLPPASKSLGTGMQA
jgi:hypothetical protein